jgi:hypothetical protein
MTRVAISAAWISAVLAAGAPESIELAAAVWPAAWITLFTNDTAAVAAGVAYLRTAGPFFGFFGFFGAGFAIYCAAQGVHRIELPVLGAWIRSAIALGGGYLAATFGGVSSPSGWGWSRSVSSVCRF